MIADQQAKGSHFVCLDGTLITTTAIHTPAPQGKDNDWWYSGRHHRHGGNVQVLSDYTGFPIWPSPVPPGSTHDIVAAREHVLPALQPAAANGLPTRGYQGAGIGIWHPIKGHALAPHTRARNRLTSPSSAPQPNAPTRQRANAILTHFRALQKFTLDPWRITQIVRSALVIATHMRGSW